MTDDLNLPMQPMDPMPMLDVADAVWASGVVVCASTIGDDTQQLPALVFRFADGHGGFHPPIILACKPEHLAELTPLIARGVDLAIEAAR